LSGLLLLLLLLNAIAILNTLSHIYWLSLYGITSVNCHLTELNRSHHNPSRRPVLELSTLGPMKGRVNQGDLLYTEMAYSSTDGRPSK